MTSKWPTERLKNVASFFNDGNWIESKDQSNEGYRLIQTGNIGIGSFRTNDHRARFVSTETFQKLKCTEVLPGDILISRLPDPIGRACIVPELTKPSITGVDCTILRLNDRVSPKFFTYFSQTPNYLKAVSEMAGGTTRQRISRKNLGEILMPLPPLDEQKRIVAKLDEALGDLDQVTQNSKTELDQIDALWNSTLNQIFNPESENPESKLKSSWQTVPLGTLFKTSSGATPLKSRKDFYQDGNIPWLLSGEVSQGSIATAKNFITEIALKETAAKLLPVNSVLVAMYGATAGQVGLLEFESATNQAVCAIYPSPNYFPKFVYYALLSMKAALVSQAAGNAQPNVSQEKIKNLQFPLASMDEQEQIVSKLDELKAQIDDLRKIKLDSIEEASALRASVLTAAFSGDF